MDCRPRGESLGRDWIPIYRSEDRAISIIFLANKDEGSFFQNEFLGQKMPPQSLLNIPRQIYENRIHHCPSLNLMAKPITQFIKFEPEMISAVTCHGSSG